MKSEKWYAMRLAKYFNRDYSQYEDVVEFYPDPAPNMWKFHIPGQDIIRIVICDDNGMIAEIPKPYPAT